MPPRQTSVAVGPVAGAALKHAGLVRCGTPRAVGGCDGDRDAPRRVRVDRRIRPVAAEAPMLARPFHVLAVLAARLARLLLAPHGIRPSGGTESGGTVFRHYL